MTNTNEIEHPKMDIFIFPARTASVPRAHIYQELPPTQLVLGYKRHKGKERRLKFTKKLTDSNNLSVFEISQPS